MNLSKYKNKLLGGSALLILAASPLIAMGTLHAFGIGIFSLLQAGIISAISCSAIVFLGLAFAVAAFKINQIKNEKADKFFREVKEYCESGTIKSMSSLVYLLENRSFFDPSNKKVASFLEAPGDDEFKTPPLHKIILSKKLDILKWFYVNIPDLDLFVKNSKSQTALDILDNNLFIPGYIIQNEETKKKLDPEATNIYKQTSKLKPIQSEQTPKFELHQSLSGRSLV